MIGPDLSHEEVRRAQRMEVHGAQIPPGFQCNTRPAWPFRRLLVWPEEELHAEQPGHVLHADYAQLLPCRW